MIQAWRYSGHVLPPDRPAGDDREARPAGSSTAGFGLGRIELARPSLAETDVLIRVEASAFGAPERAAASTDRTPGGAAVGTVVAAGDNARHAIGQRVVVGPEQPCGECDICRRGGAAVCPHSRVLGATTDGTLASHVVARARWLCALQGELALSSPAACLIGREAARAYAMFARASVAPGQPVIIVGADVISRFLVEFAVARGTQPMAVIPATNTEFAAWLESRSAIAIPITHGENAADSVTRAVRSAGHGQRPRYVFETSASPENRALASSLAGPAGTLTLLARHASARPSPIEYHARDQPRGPARPAIPGMPGLEATADADGICIGVAGAHPDLLPEVAALAVRRELDVDSAAELIAIDELADQLSRSDRTVNASQDLPRIQVATFPQL
ncbi:MAG: alcohol dehydrogenase catalytic domain-containing protein [Proteobacteria bacterium]|nr:alcohol dehydrogenase catalytic domain-containing protein [Pseudomonadota bacterium]